MPPPGTASSSPRTASSNPLLLCLQRYCHGLHVGTRGGPRRLLFRHCCRYQHASSNPLLLRLQRCCHGLHVGTRGGPGASSSARIWRGGVAVMTLEECIQEDELRRLLDNKPVPICYDGFEPPDACTSLRAL